MSPIPPPGGGKPLKYPLDKVRRDRPITVKVSGNTPAELKRAIIRLRKSVSQYGIYNGIKLVVRLTQKTVTGATLQVHWEGRRA